ncbi:MAG: nickel pincer cofactor biosynthesis protein LarC, partial [Opitutales bacterium]|nr:nickel pincer cofactor biosynthesis protein LarC [Opitutales bacterium]
ESSEHPHHHHHHNKSESDHHHGHHHHHRHLSDIIKIIDEAAIAAEAKQIAREIFQFIGEAESQVHDIPIEKIHFHEISAVDSIIDIIGCAVLLERLEISKAYCDPICVGYGMVSTQHGRLPVPAPATAKLLYGMPTYKGNEEGERVTPTGAAILKYLNPVFASTEIAIVESAYGRGLKEFIAPNVLRLSIGTVSRQADSLFSLETNLDDCPPESLGSQFQDRLKEAGAIDFTISPVTMKKGRPGCCLNALAPKAQLETVCDAILENTSAIGVRYFPVERKILERTEEYWTTPFGEFRIKTVTTPSGKSRSKIEADDLERWSREHGIPVTELRRKLENL